MINADGTGLLNVTRSKGADDRSPAWSPDGKEIAFSSDGGEGDARDLDVINVQSRALRNLTEGTGANYDPAWSPDGQKIAFASQRTDDSTGTAETVERSAPCEMLDRARDRTGRTEHREMARAVDEVERRV